MAKKAKKKDVIEVEKVVVDTATQEKALAHMQEMVKHVPEGEAKNAVMAEIHALEAEIAAIENTTLAEDANKWRNHVLDGQLAEILEGTGVEATSISADLPAETRVRIAEEMAEAITTALETSKTTVEEATNPEVIEKKVLSQQGQRWGTDIEPDAASAAATPLDEEGKKAAQAELEKKIESGDIDAAIEAELEGIAAAHGAKVSKEK